MSRFTPHLNPSAQAFFALIVLLAIALAPACASRPLRLDRAIEIKAADSNPVRIVFEDAQAMDARLVARAVTDALPKLRQWGTLREPVTIILYPTHADLENAVRHKGYAWLRAWAQYDRIHLQAPGTWGGPILERRVSELLIHELAHVVMYQTIGDRNTWKKRPVPLWFREGLASVAANQGYRRLSVEAILRDLKYLPANANPIEDGETLSRHHQALVYSLSHRMLEDLFTRCGILGISDTLSGMGNGLSFQQSFDSACPVSLSDFLSDWHTQLGLTGSAGN